MNVGINCPLPPTHFTKGFATCRFIIFWNRFDNKYRAFLRIADIGQLKFYNETFQLLLSSEAMYLCHTTTKYHLTTSKPTSRNTSSPNSSKNHLNPARASHRNTPLHPLSRGEISHHKPLITKKKSPSKISPLERGGGVSRWGARPKLRLPRYSWGKCFLFSFRDCFLILGGYAQTSHSRLHPKAFIRSQETASQNKRFENHLIIHKN